MNKTKVLLLDIFLLALIFIIIFSFVIAIMSLDSSGPVYKYKDRVIVTDGFYKGQSGYVSHFDGGIASHKYAIKTEDDTLLFIDERDLKKEDE